MDYAGWELERQRRALAALLLGGAERDALATEGPAAWQAAGPAAGNGGAAVGGTDRGGTGWKVLNPLEDRRASAVGGWSVAEWLAERIGTAAENWDRRSLTAAESRRSGRTGVYLAETLRTSGAKQVLRAVEGQAVSVQGEMFESVPAGWNRAGGWTESPSAGGGPWSGGVPVKADRETAKALSLAVQRDARRYDGGFRMY